METKITHLKELAIHKKFLIDSCVKLSTFFLYNDKEDLALELMERAFIHDISKISKGEFSALSSFESYSKYSKDKHLNFSKDEMKFLKMHWSNNKHHPEYWADVMDMNDIDIAEMVCDWHARSEEFGNNLIDYIENRQLTRFSFPEQVYSKIMYFASILIDT